MELPDGGESHEEVHGGAQEVRWVQVTKDDAFILSDSYDSTLKMWSMKTGRCLMTMRSHKRDVTSVWLASNDSRVWSVSLDNSWTRRAKKRYLFIQKY